MFLVVYIKQSGDGLVCFKKLNSEKTFLILVLRLAEIKRAVDV